LAAGKILESKYKDHQLSGNWKDHRDCHIEPDWILIYRTTPDELFVKGQFNCLKSQALSLKMLGVKSFLSRFILTINYPSHKFSIEWP